MNPHVQSMPVDMCVAVLAPLRHFCSDQQDITSLGHTCVSRHALGIPFVPEG